MPLIQTNPNDVLAIDAELDLVWPDPTCETSGSIGRGKLWRFTFDDGFTVSAVPEKGAKTYRLFSAQMQHLPVVETNRSGLSAILSDRYVANGDSFRCGWLDIHKYRDINEWGIVLRIQTGYAQSFLYPQVVTVPTLISPYSQVHMGLATFRSREEAIRAGAGVYYAATRKMAGEIWVDNHRPIVEIRREAQAHADN